LSKLNVNFKGNFEEKSMSNTRDVLTKRLESALAPLYLRIEDQSEQHAGHAGASGGGHYLVTVVSEAFEGLTLLEQHRKVHEALGELFRGQVHALALQTFPPSQWKEREKK
jgi:BolA protein